MLRPGLTLLLWLTQALLIVVNNMIGDTLIAEAIGLRPAGWYKVLVPLPYVALMATIHARRTVGPQWPIAALSASVCWPLSTALLDVLFGRLTYHEELADVVDRYGVQWGAPFPWLLLAQALLPLVCGWVTMRTARSKDRPR